MTIHSPLARRRGLTLTEALVAMFVAAIGMISLLALFPLGALQMGQALKDSRCTETATNAEAQIRGYWKFNVLEPASPDPFVSAFGVSPGLSEPVFIDPIGVTSRAAIDPLRNMVALNPGGPPRRTLSPTFGPPIQPFRYCSLLDDMTFNESGAPVALGPGQLERAGRYNWTAVLQRTNNTVTAYEANLTILVFDGRSVGYIAPNAELAFLIPPPSPAIIDPTADPFVGSTSLTIATGGTVPLTGKGRWIGLWTSGGTRQARFLSFYRVVSVDDSVTNTVTFQLQTPIKPGHSRVLQLASDTPPTTQVLVFAGLAEVFERAPLTAN